MSEQKPFILNEVTSDYQEVSIQGHVTFKINDPKLISRVMNSTLDSNFQDYVSEDPFRLSQKVINEIQVLIRSNMQKYDLKSAVKLGHDFV